MVIFQNVYSLEDSFYICGLLNIHIYYFKLCVNVYLCEYVHMGSGIHSIQKRTAKFLGDGVRADVNHLEWAMGPELRSSARGV